MGKNLGYLVLFAFAVFLSGFSFAEVMTFTPTTARPVHVRPGDEVLINFTYTDTFACGYDLEVYKSGTELVTGGSGGIRPIRKLAFKRVVGGLCDIVRELLYGFVRITGVCDRNVVDTILIPANAEPGYYDLLVKVFALDSVGECPSEVTNANPVASIEAGSIIIEGIEPDLDNCEMFENNIANNSELEPPPILMQGAQRLQKGEPIMVGCYEPIAENEAPSNEDYSFGVEQTAPRVFARSPKQSIGSFTEIKEASSLLSENVFRENVPENESLCFSTFELSKISLLGEHSMQVRAGERQLEGRAFNMVPRTALNVRNELFFTTFIGWWNVNYNLKRMYFERYDNLAQVASTLERES